MIKDAQNRLKILEKQQQKAVTSSVQNDLFTIEPEVEVVERVIEVEKKSPALEYLQSIDVDNLTPRQALEQLYALKEKL